jgi:hypothetical protein
VTSATFTQEFASWLPRWWSHQWYVQDDWKPMKGLTIALGLRWSYETPFQTKYGQQSEFDPTVKDPASGLMGAIVHRPGQLAKRDLNNFAPRIGLAWNFHPKVVFRSSFGVVHQDIFATGTNIMYQEYLATATQAPVGDPQHVFRLSQGPALPIRHSTGRLGAVHRHELFEPLGDLVGSQDAMPYVLNWSGGLQWEFARNWLLAQYQGQSGVGLINSWDINTIPLNVSNDINVLNTIFQATQNYKPYTQFGSINHFSNYGHNTYHGGTWRGKAIVGRSELQRFLHVEQVAERERRRRRRRGVTFYNRR